MGFTLEEKRTLSNSIQSTDMDIATEKLNPLTSDHIQQACACAHTGKRGNA